MGNQLSASIPFRSNLEKDILSVLLYFDIFHHPLTPQEIYSYLPSDSTSPATIQKLCLEQPLSSVLSHDDKRYFHLKDAPPACVRERILNERRAIRRGKIARLMARLISRFPFVRAIFISGELSKGVASQAGDIDYVIVTAKDRLWICRTLLILFKKIFLLNSKKYFCLNHFITESNLTVHQRNIYAALEIATLQPLVNKSVLLKYFEHNRWIHEFYPNLSLPLSAGEEKQRTSVIQRILEWPFRGPLADRVDDWLMRQWQVIWRNRYTELSEAKRNQIFRCEKDISTAYAGDFMEHILNAYLQRLERFGLRPPDISQVQP